MADGRVLAQPAPFVGIDSFGGSSISYITRVWVRNGDYWNVYYALNEAVRSSFYKARDLMNDGTLIPKSVVTLYQWINEGV